MISRNFKLKDLAKGENNWTTIRNLLLLAIRVEKKALHPTFETIWRENN